jgi:transposase-like protein
MTRKQILNSLQYLDNIDWLETKKRFGYVESTKLSNKRVVYKCPSCSRLFEITYKEIKRKSQPGCKECALAAVRQQINESIKANYIEHPELIQQIATRAKRDWDGVKTKVAEGVKRIWQRPDFVEKKRQECISRNKIIWSEENRATTIQKIRDAFTPEQLLKSSDNSLANWRDPSYAQKIADYWDDSNRQKTSQASKKMWMRAGHRDKMAVIRITQPRTSSIQEILYSILDDLGIQYYREYSNKPADKECLVGPYTFDCVIPRGNKTTLLIECQGNYWHSISGRCVRDEQKASYISNNLSAQYELKCLWEHEFSCKDKIIETLKYWLGISAIEQIDFNFNDISIKLAPPADYKPLLGKYHYLPNAGRGGIAYGAYLKNELIAVCVFSPLIRQNISIQDYAKNEVRELSRLCLHPKYRKKNFLSWFVSSCLRLLDKKYRCIISYCDTTYNHTGAIYKACNFILDSEVPPDYWYVSTDGWIMHKRTLYGHAIKMSMTESQYAELNNYHRVYGEKKLRFIYSR